MNQPTDALIKLRPESGLQTSTALPRESNKFVRSESFDPSGIDGCVSLGAKGALAGLYLGAIPIPLDWDRPWQEWPTTCVVGTLVGHVLGLAYYVILTLSDMRKETKRNKMI